VTDTEPGDSLAADVFAEFLALSERQPDLDFDEFCREHAEFEDELRLLYGQWSELAGMREHLDAAGSAYLGDSSEEEPDVEAGVTIDPSLRMGDVAPRALIARLTGRSGNFTRYRMQGEIGRGGMGKVLRVWDPDLRRTLAMKVVRQEEGAPHEIDARLLSRFLEEAQISGQLDHPGIVPLHEIGMDPDGQVYFTMKLVKGKNLRDVFAECEAEKNGWTRPRVVGVLQKVCEAVAYAHAKGVLHRDLKPTNIMVGHFGEVYVMDWGLARILGAPTAAAPSDGVEESSIGLRPIATDRHDASDSNPDSPMYTVEGDVLGTPAYMSPEQALGSREEIGPRADVYSLGAMLYQHLTGHVPYLRPGEAMTARLLVERVRNGPPVAIDQLAVDAPVELVAICERAMARSVDERYTGASELGDDLRAFLEGRVVRAYRTGALIELRKWVARNRILAATACLLVLALVAGLLTSSSLLVEVRASETRVLRMSDLKRLVDLRQRADSLYPVDPALRGDYEVWLDEAGRLIDRMDLHQATLAELRSQASEWTDEQRAQDRETHPQYDFLQSQSGRIEELEGWIAGLERGDPETRVAVAKAYEQRREFPTMELLVESRDKLQRSIDPIEGDVAERRSWLMPSTELQWEHDTLAGLVRDLESLADPEQGMMREIRGRMELAETVGMLSVLGEQPAHRWKEALASISDKADCPAYGGLELEPQIGLVPIGRDPWSDLWEFAFVQSGVLPVRDAEGMLEVNPDSAMVFVLVPGGSFWIGAQKTDPDGRHYDPVADTNEAPVHEVHLDPYFLSKYEMTQSQWSDLNGSNPSYYVAGSFVGGQRINGQHPVEQVSWTDATRALARLGLGLPTEAQWERAVRAYTDTPWFDGAEKTALLDAANVCDAHAKSRGMNWGAFDEWLDDGHSIHAPVGTFRPNPFGIHDMYGNVFEHCKDTYGPYTRAVESGTGERIGWSTNRVLRGGAFDVTHLLARASTRSPATSTFNGFNVGVRPSRPIR